MNTNSRIRRFLLIPALVIAGFGIQSCKKAPPKDAPAAPSAAGAPVAAPATPAKSGSGVQLRRSTGRDGAEMVEIPAGEFDMGSRNGEPDERPVHKVRLGAFMLDVKPVTNAMYAAFLNDTGGRSEQGGNRLVWTFVRGVRQTGSRWEAQKGCAEYPAIGVTWHGAEAYARHYGKRLPTEAEWEYACRAGSAGSWCFGDDAKRLGEFAWYQANSGTDMHAPGGKSPNAWGIHDMHGNVWEWCADWYDEGYYARSPEKDPKGSSIRGLKVLRGGSRLNTPARCRSANRGASYPEDKDGTIGFRCAAAVR